MDPPPPSPLYPLTTRRYLIPWGRVFSSRGHAFDSAMVAAFYFVFKCVRCASGVGGSYVFESKVEVVNAFDSKILARETGGGWRKTSEKRANNEREARRAFGPSHICQIRADMGHPTREASEETACRSRGVGHRLGHGGSPLQNRKACRDGQAFSLFLL